VLILSLLIYNLCFIRVVPEINALID